MTATFQMFGITLGAIEFNPGILTPDTLRYNEVVDQDWVLTSGSTFSMSETSFSYNNGVEISSSEDMLTFRQVAPDLASEEILTPELISRYLGSDLPGEWFSVALDFGIRIDAVSDLPPDDGRMWQDFVRDLKVNDTEPELRTSLIYDEVDGRNLFVELLRRQDLTGQMLLCFGRVARALDENGVGDAGGTRHHVLNNVLEGWNTDLNEVVELGNRLARKIFRLEAFDGSVT